MDILLFIYGWFYYGFIYMALSSFMTIVLNKATNRLWLTPLIINAVSIIILFIMINASWITGEDASFVMYFNYMPIVISSIATNIVISLIGKVRRKKGMKII